MFPHGPCNHSPEWLCSPKEINRFLWLWDRRFLAALGHWFQRPDYSQQAFLSGGKIGDKTLYLSEFLPRII